MVMIAALIYLGLIIFIVEIFYYYNPPQKRYTDGEGDDLPTEIRSLFSAIYNAHPITVTKKSKHICDITLKIEMCRFQAFITQHKRKITIFVFTYSHEYIYESTNIERNLILLNALNGHSDDIIEIPEAYKKLSKYDKVTYFK
ncbi:putative membrane protein [Vibrio phage vB_VchM_Kuja]|uniref:Putative membrane protein n=1 Tax=Vibrio phage vB_VchM_Kuja TaxID=2686437 RepID=A0A6B9J7P8_9CAUD|nr:hypothetical protein HWC83_gp173 [Vibrio phage vB_VchM_Kuja]QGZ16054.1 putative membrane protein [Vibrio phage vB_VchM_Kuja]